MIEDCSAVTYLTGTNPLATSQGLEKLHSLRRYELLFGYYTLEESEDEALQFSTQPSHLPLTTNQDIIIPQYAVCLR